MKAKKKSQIRKKYSIGIDEVGRGPLAGPVVVAAVAIPRGFRIWNLESGELKDSKKLSPKKREKWFKYVKNHPRILYTAARVTPKVIDRINITNAANLAATRALKKLNSRFYILNSKILLDGGLHLQKNSDSRFQIPNSKTIVKGDEKYNCIKLASIVAKVTRDRYMSKICHKKFPKYGFNIHKGYGTKTHILALKKHGFSPLHRLTFIKKYATLS